MIAIRRLPLQHDDCMGARLDAILAAAECASEWVRWVAVIVENEIWVALASEPTGNPDALLRDRITHGGFGAGAVIPGRGGRDVAFPLQTFSKFRVGAPNVLTQGVATRGFVLREIAPCAG
jgi:hypothetical protein